MIKRNETTSFDGERKEEEGEREPEKGENVVIDWQLERVCYKVLCSCLS